MSKLPIHEQLIAIEYDPADESLRAESNPALNNTAFQLARRVIGMTCNHLVRSPKNNRLCLSVKGKKEDADFRIPTLVCDVPLAAEALPATAFRLFDPAFIRARKGRRPTPPQFAHLCIASLRSSFGDSPELQTTDDQGLTVWHSGPDPVNERDLKEAIMYIPELRAQLPPDADGYLEDIHVVCSTIFSKVTGGVVPHVGTEMVYLNLK